METPHFDSQEGAGKEFDKWLDWNGNADSSPDSSAFAPSASGGSNERHHSLYPISPSASSNSDSRRSARNSASFTATTTIDLPTPTHSSESPEITPYADFGQGADAARAYPVIASRPVLKRKLSPQDVPTTSLQEETNPPTKKRPHNVIEKRYRANLNEKIAELRDSVPSLRIVKKTQTGEDQAGDSENEDLDGLTPGSKLNKASILTKAVEYIRHLETRNRRLDDENRSLKERLQTLDKVLAHGGTNDQRAAAFTSQQTIESAQGTDTEARDPEDEESKKPARPPQGLIPLPDSWRKFRETQSQEHYGHIYDTPSEGRIHAGKWPARIMLGSLAGLLIMEGFGESNQGTTSKEKGLFGIPLELLDGYRFLRSPRIYLAAFGQFCRAGGVIPLIKGFMALSIMAFFVFAYLFNSKPISPKQDEECSVGAQESPSLASPIEVRRRAWSTSMQTLGLPHHHFFQEWLAVTTEWLKYSVRYLFGVKAYTWVTGRSGEDEVARVKAWDIAIDAQLAGGDPEISRSRVVLTSFGSGTLPPTPLRLMLKSLHCRVLLWRVGQQASISSRIANKLATLFANREWRKAQQTHEELSSGHPDRLPSWLATLLDKDCDDVFRDSVVQRAYNLMYDRPTSEHSEDYLLDVIVEDHAIRSPLDAVAAWWSTQSLRQALISSIQSSQDGAALEYLQAALAVAPPGSAAQTRALALHAVFHSHLRQDYYSRASNSLSGPSMSSTSEFSAPYFIDSSTPVSARSDVSTVLHCAEVMMSLDPGSPIDRSLQVAIRPYLTASVATGPTSLLGFAATYFVLQQLQRNGSANASRHIPDLVQSLCSWLHKREQDVSLVPTDIIEKIESSGLSLGGSMCKRRLSNVSNDTGYETQGDEDDPSPIFIKSDVAPRLIGGGDYQV